MIAPQVLRLVFPSDGNGPIVATLVLYVMAEECTPQKDARFSSSTSKGGATLDFGRAICWTSSLSPKTRLSRRSAGNPRKEFVLVVVLAGLPTGCVCLFQLLGLRVWTSHGRGQVIITQREMND